MALTAADLSVLPREREVGGVVAERKRGSQRCPAGRRVAALAGEGEHAVGRRLGRADDRYDGSEAENEKVSENHCVTSQLWRRGIGRMPWEFR